MESLLSHAFERISGMALWTIALVAATLLVLETVYLIAFTIFIIRGPRQSGRP